MHVALHRPDDGLAERLRARIGQIRLEHLRPRAHGAGRHEHLGDEDLVGAEFVADDAHGADQTLVEDLGGIATLLESPLDERRDLLALAALNGRGDVFENGHGAFLSRLCEVDLAVSIDFVVNGVVNPGTC